MPQLWVTYIELADHLNIGPETARSLVHIRQWDRRRSHDGLTRVKLPADEALLYMANHISDNAASSLNDMKSVFGIPCVSSARNEKIA